MTDPEINPIPDDFSPPISDDGRLLKWLGMIGGKRYELGLRPARDAASLLAARVELRGMIWQLNEYQRLGRADLMAYAAVDRHRARSLPR